MGVWGLETSFYSKFFKLFYGYQLKESIYFSLSGTRHWFCHGSIQDIAQCIHCCQYEFMTIQNMYKKASLQWQERLSSMSMTLIIHCILYHVFDKKIPNLSQRIRHQNSLINFLPRCYLCSLYISFLQSFVINVLIDSEPMFYGLIYIPIFKLNYFLQLTGNFKSLKRYNLVCHCKFNS